MYIYIHMTQRRVYTLIIFNYIYMYIYILCIYVCIGLYECLRVYCMCVFAPLYRCFSGSSMSGTWVVGPRPNAFSHFYVVPEGPAWLAPVAVAVTSSICFLTNAWVRLQGWQFAKW